MTDRTFSGIIARWQSAEGSSEDLKSMLLAAGWAAPIDKPTRLDTAIAKLETRRKHHERIAQMDEDYAEQVGDVEEATICRQKAAGRRQKVADYKLARDILVHIRQGSRR